jgi:hypothetical protein
MTTPTMTWTRLSRRLGSDHNPLRRRSDLIEAWLLPAVIAAFLVLSVPVMIAATWWTHAGDTAARHTERSWHQVPAVLLRATPGPMMTDRGANYWIAWAPARWTAGGRQHVSKIPVVAGTSAGRTVAVWLDRAGHVRIPPLTANEANGRAATAAGAALVALAVLLAGLGALGRWWLDRRRLAGWDAAWLLESQQRNHRE